MYNKIIFEEWVQGSINVDEMLNLWDSMAEQYKEREIPEQSTSRLLQIFHEKKMLQPDYEVLDIGCGTGRYSFAISDQVKSVVGLDFSNKMISYGKEIQENLGIQNIEMIQADWITLDLEEKGLAGRFDLVFANMAPAISSAVALRKMIEAGKGFFVLSKPTKRSDWVFDEIRNGIGRGIKTQGMDEDIAYSFAFLWNCGFEPEIEYEKQRFVSLKKTEDVIYQYSTRLRSERPMSTIEETLVREMLRKKAVDDHIKEIITTTVVYLSWHK